jgi:hypothetical protein
MKKIFAVLIAGSLLLSGCDTSSTSKPRTSDKNVYSDDPAPRRIPIEIPSEAKPTTKQPAPDKTEYQSLKYGSSYRLIIDGGDVSILVSDPANSNPAVTNSGTQIVTFNVTIKARSAWDDKSAKLSFDSKTTEDFFLITNNGPDPLSEDIAAGATKVYKMTLEAPMDTYKRGSISLSVSGKKVATWS